jgi:hypothetical protein
MKQPAGNMKTKVVFMLTLCSLLMACSRWNVEPKTTAAGASKAAFSQGQAVVSPTKGYDLDAGKMLSDGSVPADFYWNVEQIGTTKTLRGELYAHNGAKFTITTLDPSSVSVSIYPTLVKQTFSDYSIATDASVPIRQNSIIAYQTNEGRLGLFRVDRLGADMSMTMTWLTFAK